MAGMSGKRIPVIFLTDSWEEVGARLPDYPLLRKPFTSAQLTEKVRAVFQSDLNTPEPDTLAA